MILGKIKLSHLFLPTFTLIFLISTTHIAFFGHKLIFSYLFCPLFSFFMGIIKGFWPYFAHFSFFYLLLPTFLIHFGHNCTFCIFFCPFLAIHIKLCQDKRNNANLFAVAGQLRIDPRTQSVLSLFLHKKIRHTNSMADYIKFSQQRVL